MTCRQFEDHLEALVGGTLPETLAAELERHRESCPACDQRYRTLWALYDLSVDSPCNPPEGFCDAVMEKIDALERDNVIELSAPTAPRRKFRYPFTAVAAAAVVLLFAGSRIWAAPIMDRVAEPESVASPALEPRSAEDLPLTDCLPGSEAQFYRNSDENAKMQDAATGAESGGAANSAEPSAPTGTAPDDAVDGGAQSDEIQSKGDGKDRALGGSSEAGLPPVDIGVTPNNLLVLPDPTDGQILAEMVPLYQTGFAFVYTGSAGDSAEALENLERDQSITSGAVYRYAFNGYTAYYLRAELEAQLPAEGLQRASEPVETAEGTLRLDETAEYGAVLLYDEPQ
ncbi:anti-sigma factor family protein [Feifania hominis]|uniref:Zinc-finger domain-containing protein n=1 Tax=Feifania hominis TaxID=2763660 RepID=A0A926HV04_9FIRM|nr:anti-sigma factor [Feifania hominis]MBC8536480.1 hypothetical protein [Feifania hominis]